MKRLFFASLTAILIIAFSFGEAKAIEEKDVVLALSFDEGKGEEAKDASPYGNDGTLMHDPEWVDGKVGKALEFDGVTQKYVVVADEEKVLNLERTDSFTMAAWIKLSDKTQGDLNQHLIVNAAGCKPTCVGFALSPREPPGVLAMILINSPGGTTFVQGSTDIIDEQWHHVAAVNDGSLGGAAKGIKLYVDGKLEKMEVLSDTLGTRSILTDDPVTIGDRLIEGCPCPAKGIIDEVYIFKKALNANETKQVYQASGIGDVLSVHPQGKLATTWSLLKSD